MRLGESCSCCMCVLRPGLGNTQADMLVVTNSSSSPHSETCSQSMSWCGVLEVK